jgi:hypothetical protein
VSFGKKIHGALVELSIAPLYRDQIPLEEMIAYLKKHGLSLWRLRRGCYDKEIMRDFEVDGLFMKKDYMFYYYIINEKPISQLLGSY